jgi:hypothetical protein
MKLRDLVDVYIVCRISQGSFRHRNEILDFSDFMGDADLSELNTKTIRKFITRESFQHYQALRFFLLWLDKQKKHEEPPPTKDVDFDYLFRQLNRGRGVFLGCPRIT